MTSQASCRSFPPLVSSWMTAAEEGEVRDGEDEGGGGEDEGEDEGEAAMHTTARPLRRTRLPSTAHSRASGAGRQGEGGGRLGCARSRLRMCGGV